jgi:hypothetical protein
MAVMRLQITGPPSNQEESLKYHGESASKYKKGMWNIFYKEKFEYNKIRKRISDPLVEYTARLIDELSFHPAVLFLFRLML